jgi:hypothetical protein
MDYVALFFAGAFLCNAIPHLVCAMQGSSFPTPFAKPPGVGESSPLINFVWGAFNFLVGLVLLCDHPLIVGCNPRFLALTSGAFIIGIHLSWHFGNVRQKK